MFKKEEKHGIWPQGDDFFSDGATSGIRHVEIANWSGQAIACPRSRLNELRDWVEAQRPGVYFFWRSKLPKRTIGTVTDSLPNLCFGFRTELEILRSQNVTSRWGVDADILTERIPRE